jgi:hypothetical protein
MSTFVLPQHANKETLKTLFKGFRTRLQASGHVELLLKGMNDALSNRSSHCLIYWPVTNDEWHTKTCVYDQTYERGKESAVCFHLVYLTTLLSKLNKTATHFNECQCHNHTRGILFDWHEFVYPQFVELLSKRTLINNTAFLDNDERSISAPPTPSSPISLSRERSLVRIVADHDDGIERAHHIELRAHQNREKELSQFIDDAFAIPGEVLVDRYHKESALAQFGVETIQHGVRHFRQRRVTIDDHKLFYILEDVKVRAPLLSGGAIEIKACSDDMPPYVVICSNFTLRMPAQGGHKVYHLHLPGCIARPRQLVDQDFGAKRRIDCRDLCADSRLCMIISRAPLRIEFQEMASLMLVTRGVCKFDLEHAIIEMWAPMKTIWPCAYEVESARRVMIPSPQDTRYYFERLHATYHELFSQGHFALSRPCIGHMTFEQASMHDITIRTTPGFINQYGTMLPLPSPSETIAQCHYNSVGIDLVGLRVQFPIYKAGEEEGAMPHFYTREGSPLLLVEQTYEFAGNRYILHGLCAKKGDPVVCFFKLSARRDYVLFIPVVLATQ